MSVPPVIVGKPALVTWDDGFEEAEQVMKNGVKEGMEKTSEEFKKNLKEKSDASITENVPSITSPIKNVIAFVTPKPMETLTPVINQSIDSFSEKSTKDITHKMIDTSVDTTAKKVADRSIETSVGASKSIASWGYNKTQAVFKWQTEEKK